MAKLKWTKELVQEKSNEIHNNGFIIHNIEVKGIGRFKRSYINTICKNCGYINNILIDNHINKKIGCRQCSGLVPLTLEEIQEKSNKIHNNKFIVTNLIRKKVKKFKTAHIDIKCKICGYKNNVIVNNHINKDQGCNSKLCKSGGNRKHQIENLKNKNKSNELYKLYFLKFTEKETGEQFYKVGKTKKRIKCRFSDKDYNRYIIEECQVVKGTHLWVSEQEDKFISKYYNDYGYIPNEKFSGYTECFSTEISKYFI